MSSNTPGVSRKEFLKSVASSTLVLGAFPGLSLAREERYCQRIGYPDPASGKRMHMSDNRWTYDIRAISSDDARILQEQALNAHHAKASDEILRHVRSLRLIEEGADDSYRCSMRTATLARSELPYGEKREDQWVSAALCLRMGGLFVPENSRRFVAEVLKPYIDEHIYLSIRLLPFFESNPELFQRHASAFRRERWYDSSLGPDVARLGSWNTRALAANIEPLSFEALAKSVRRIVDISPWHVFKTKLLKIGEFKIRSKGTRPTDDFERFVKTYLVCD